MTIKAIKEKYKNCGKEIFGCGKIMFTTWDYKDGNGKVVIVVSNCGWLGKDVIQVIRVSDGKELLSEERCRPCDNLDDAIDVAGEMMREEV